MRATAIQTSEATPTKLAIIGKFYYLNHIFQSKLLPIMKSD